MNKKLTATALMFSLLTAVPAFAGGYTSGDGRYDSPDFDRQLVQAEAKAVKEDRPAEDKLEEEKRNPLPIMLTADQANYDSVSGDFVVEGNVKIQQGTETLLTTKAEGNLKTGDVWMHTGATMVQPNSKMTADWAYYNFNNKTGELKQIHGKGNKDNYKSPHAVIDAEKMTFDEGGVMSRCPAQEHVPCLSIKAKTFEIYPNDKMVAHQAKVYVKGVHVYSKDLWVNYLNDSNATRIMPKIGYDGSDNGMYVGIRLSHNFSEKTDVRALLPYYTGTGDHFRPVINATHRERNFDITYKNGWEEEDDEWVEKQNEFGINYKPHYFIDGIPVTYRLYATRGLWENDDTGVKSWHMEYGAYLDHDRIYLFNSQKTFLDLTIGKKWVDESYTDETRSTMAYYATLGQKLTDKWNTWVGYYREDITSSLYDIGQPDMAREWRNGISYRADDRNTFSVVNRYDAGEHSNYETSFKWVHRFCCWTLSIEYVEEQFKGENDELNIEYRFDNL